MKLLLVVAIVAAFWTSTNAQCTDLTNCDSCMNPGPLCEDCPYGTVLSQDSTKCLLCGTGCMTCTSDAADAVTCTSCSWYYYLKDGACSYCGDGCTACHEDAGTIVCDTCMTEGFVQDLTSTAQECIACDNYCKTCSLAEDGSTTCSECYSYQGSSTRGYYLKAADKSCKSCPTYCEKCADDGNGVGICSSCYAGYEIIVDEVDSTNDGKKCIRCPSECSSCSGVALTTSTATCLECVTLMGLYLTGGECLVCDENCLTCEDDGTCSECDDYYRVEGGSCVACPPFCITCTLDETSGIESCETCRTSYGTKEAVSVTCDACGISNCATCTRSSSDGTMSCGSCKDGYGFDENAKCTSCSSGCNRCSWSTDHMKCTECKADYTATVFPATGSSSVGTPSACTACGSNCVTCDHDATTGNMQCTGCDTDYFVDNTPTDPICTALLPNCITGDASNGKCSACDVGYTVDVGGECDQCTASFCETCANTDLTVCTGCAIGSGLVDTDFDNTTDACESCSISKCNKCITWAGYAGASKMCFDCEVGYQPYDSAEGTRKATMGPSCKKCPTGCNTCTVDYGDSDKTKCVSNECSSWADNNLKKAYVNADDGACALCPTNCMSCTWDSSTQTTSCVTGNCNGKFVVNEDTGECDACPDNCNACDYDASLSSVVCQDNQCDTGYGKITDGTCPACPGNCATCSISDETDADDTLFCDTCSQSYGINSDVCGACPSNCAECKDTTGTMECTLCKDGYSLDSSATCIKCPTACAECTAKGTLQCIECNDGYALEPDKLSCTVCSTAAFENCAECGDVNSTTLLSECDECMTGYTLEDELETLSCKSTSALVCNGGDEYDDGPQCTTCSAGYTVTDDFECAFDCYTCGDMEAGEWVAQASCAIPAEGANVTEGFATKEECTKGACYAAYKDGQVIAGCIPMSVNNGVCAADYSTEYCFENTADNFCVQCCDSENCNTFVETMDGIAGAAFVTVNLLLVTVAALLAIH